MEERVVIDKSELTTMADAVRSVTGSTEPMTVNELVSEITNNISALVKRYELVFDKTFTEADTAEQLYFTEESNGTPFDFEAVKILLTVPGGLPAQNYAVVPYCGQSFLLWNGMLYNSTNQTEDTRDTCGGVELKIDKYGDWEGWFSHEIAVPHALINKYTNNGLIHKSSADYPSIDSIYFYCEDAATSEIAVPHPGTRLQVFAVRR